MEIYNKTNQLTFFFSLSSGINATRDELVAYLESAMVATIGNPLGHKAWSLSGLNIDYIIPGSENIVFADGEKNGGREGGEWE